MGIQDFRKTFVVINGTTNEQIKVPYCFPNYKGLFEVSYNDYCLLTIIKDELHDNNSLTVLQMYDKG